MKPTVLLDVDGVLANFVRAYLGLLEDTLGIKATEEQITAWDIATSLGLTKEQSSLMKRVVYVWQVMAVLEDGRCIGNCGHNHMTELAAVRCPWAPDDWNDHLVCDLLVRQVRDRRIDPVRTRRSKAA